MYITRHMNKCIHKPDIRETFTKCMHKPDKLRQEKHSPHEKLACPPMLPPLSCAKNVDFVVFILFLPILHKLSPTCQTYLGNPVMYVQT